MFYNAIAMKLYHGTDYVSAMSIFKKGINLSYSRWFNDFGRGFYTSTSLERAKGRARYKTAKAEKPPCVVCFDFNYKEAIKFITKYDDKDCAYFCAINRFQINEHNNVISAGKIADSNIIKLGEKLKKMNYDFTPDDVAYIINPNDKVMQYAFHTADSLTFLNAYSILAETGDGK